LIMQIIYYPLVFLRNYSIPMSDKDDWDKLRASIIPITFVLSFFYLFGNLNDLANDDDQDAKNSSWMYLWISLGAMVPGAILGLWI